MHGYHGNIIGIMPLLWHSFLHSQCDYSKLLCWSIQLVYTFLITLLYILIHRPPVHSCVTEASYGNKFRTLSKVHDRMLQYFVGNQVKCVNISCPFPVATLRNFTPHKRYLILSVVYINIDELWNCYSFVYTNNMKFVYCNIKWCYKFYI